jgi:hypothetical protein
MLYLFINLFLASYKALREHMNGVEKFDIVIIIVVVNVVFIYF